MNESPASRGPLPWSQRIGFRLFLVFAGLAIVAYFGFPHVHSTSLRLLGLPPVDRGLFRVDPLPTPPEDVSLLAGADLRPRGDIAFVVDALFAESDVDETGRRVPTPERQRAVADALGIRGQGYLLLDTDQVLVCRSGGLDLEGLEVGEPVPFAPSDLGEAELFGDGRIGIGHVPVAIFLGGAHAGWLVLFAREKTVPGSGPAYLTSEEYDRTIAWSGRIINLFSLGFIASLALGLAWALSRVVTRRVSGLAELAAAAPSGGALPGPFDERGDDEIAVLARSMNEMRARVLQLLEDQRRGDRERRRWIAQVSHDLRTPLTALIASLERAVEDLRGQRLAGLTEKLDDARLDAERLNELAEDLLDVARIDADERIVREPVPPGELVRQAARGLKHLAERSKVEIRVDLAPHLPELEADGRRLMRALENLLRNALHHARSIVRVRAAAIGDRVRFSVLDDGPGLPVEPGENVWKVLSERLSRPDSAGLGLVVVRRVAELHGGDTGAENRPEGGACVWIEVPTG